MSCKERKKREKRKRGTMDKKTKGNQAKGEHEWKLGEIGENRVIFILSDNIDN